MKRYSIEIKRKEYDTQDKDNYALVFNTLQALKYMEYGVPVIDMFPSRGTLVFVFDAKKAKRPHELWCERKL